MQGAERFNAVRCGRRFGKTKLLEYLASDPELARESVGIFTPEYKQLAEPWDNLVRILGPIIQSSNKNEGSIHLKPGGKVDFWAVIDNELAGRGRGYKRVLIDEAAFTKNGQMMKIWERSIKPTLLTTRGDGWVFSTPNGVHQDNFFYQICNDPAYGFKEFHAPTADNPFVPPDELEKERATNHPQVFQQEYLAEFVDWSGIAFFSLEKMLDQGKPVPYPNKCDGVFAIIDTALKSGKDNDGTAVIYVSFNKHFGTPLIVLDWDIVQIDGAFLNTWMPGVFAKLEELSRATASRKGVIGAFVEDANAGTILLQQARTKPAWSQLLPIESKLTAKGKDERALDASGYFHQGLIKLSQYAYDKTVKYKGVMRNHLLTQVTGFRLGDPEAAKRADDLLDCFVYALILGAGDKHGY